MLLIKKIKALNIVVISWNILTGVNHTDIHSEVGDSNRSLQTPKTGGAVTIFKIYGQFIFPYMTPKQLKESVNSHLDYFSLANHTLKTTQLTSLAISGS